jgi:hypothetical protein
MVSFLIAMADPDVGLLSFLVSIIVSILRVVPLKKIWLSRQFSKKGNETRLAH